MKALVPLKQFLSDHFPMMTVDKCHLLIVNGTQKDGYLEYTARLLIIDYRADPVEVIMVIREWLKSNNLHLDETGKDIQISFSSEIIDSETFDLEIDFPQRDKVISNCNGYHICPDLVWNELQGGFFPKGG
ncbi:phage tail protein [Acinetobacter sp. NIPH 1852]|uniref:phage tail protein n=1 Tax=Acinetobacter sp. NIPH 1852 TaxID=2923428 RepID=UPI001F4B2BD5|nr:phage tail protein [Acinetobacter sp. NIPH 1852]MCH7306616.1 phage tail protein [Acinetobacter sp. NIPH 1852]